MPAFSVAFLKRLRALSIDSPSFTRIPGMLGITSLRPDWTADLSMADAAAGCKGSGPLRSAPLARDHPLHRPPHGRHRAVHPEHVHELRHRRHRRHVAAADGPLG